MLHLAVLQHCLRLRALFSLLLGIGIRPFLQANTLLRPTANLHCRAAQRRNQRPGNDGGPDIRFRLEARGNCKGHGHGQRQGHYAYRQAGPDIIEKTLTRIACECGEQAGTTSRQVIPFSDQFESRREAADSAVARQGEATTYRIDLELE